MFVKVFTCVSVLRWRLHWAKKCFVHENMLSVAVEIARPQPQPQQSCLGRAFPPDYWGQDLSRIGWNNSVPCDESSVSRRICNQRLAKMKKLRSPCVFISCFRSTAVLLEVKSCPIHNKYVAHWSGPAPTALRTPPPLPSVPFPFVVCCVRVHVRVRQVLHLCLLMCAIKKQISGDRDS